MGFSLGNFARKHYKDFIIIVLISVIAVLAWNIYDQGQMIEFVNNEKEELRAEYGELLAEYDSLQTDNDTLNARFTAEQEKIVAIMEELETVKATNATRIREYKKELETLRKIMKGYIVQLDSLNTLNQALIAENIEVKSNYREARGKIQELSTVKKDLESKVTIGSVIQAKNVDILLLNENDKIVNKDGEDAVKAKKVGKIKVKFTLRENPLAKNGDRNVFIRIARPDGLVLTSPADEGFFTFQEQEIAYSARREVDYQNRDIDMSIIWKNEHELPEGNYTVDVFIDGNMIGTGGFRLK